MRLVFLVILCFLSAGCVKTQLQPFPTVMQIKWPAAELWC
jgi:hypothetical protein